MTLNCSYSSVGYKRERYDEKLNELKSMLTKVGWLRGFFEKNTPVLPNSGWNVLKNSENMACRKGMKVFEAAEEFPVDSWYDVLDQVCKVPSGPLTVSTISGVYKIKDVGDAVEIHHQRRSEGRW